MTSCYKQHLTDGSVVTTATCVYLTAPNTLIAAEKRVKYHRPCFSSIMSAFHIAKVKPSTERHMDT